MQAFLSFLEQNYLWFLIVAIVLVLALIGYYVDVKKDAIDSPFKKSKTKVEVVPDNAMENINIQTNMSLNEMINKSASNINNNNNINNNQ